MGLKERVQEFRRDASVRGDLETLNKLLKRELMVRFFGWDPAAAQRFLDWGKVSLSFKQIKVELSHPGPDSPKQTLSIPIAPQWKRALEISVTAKGFGEDPYIRSEIARFKVPFNRITFDAKTGGVAFISATGEEVATIWPNTVSLAAGFQARSPYTDMWVGSATPGGERSTPEQTNPADTVKLLASADVFRRGGGKI